MSIQATFDSIKNKIETKASDAIEERLGDIADYAVMISPVSTGAYVNSFSIGKAGFGGGRVQTSANKPMYQDEGLMKQQALDNLYGDIERLSVKQGLEDGITRFTLRNRAAHATNVENGIGWTRTAAYHVFEKIRSQFR
tara:strand:+ start:1040 stop:1456 length:417 start_codon:yes stop_codon:yes gene_type:complete